jgi:hypothetical protein
MLRKNQKNAEPFAPADMGPVRGLPAETYACEFILHSTETRKHSEDQIPIAFQIDRGGSVSPETTI